VRLQAARERCSLLRGAVGDPSSDAELLLTRSHPCAVCGLLQQSFWLGSSSERSFRKGLLLPGICTSRGPSEESISPLPAAYSHLCCSQLAGAISTSNGLHLNLKLSELEGQGQQVSSRGLCVPRAAWVPGWDSRCGRAARTTLRVVHNAASPLLRSGDLADETRAWLTRHALPWPAIAVAVRDGRAPRVSLTRSRGGFCCCFPRERYLGVGTRSDCALPVLTGWLGQGELQIFHIIARLVSIWRWKLSL